MRVRVYAPLIKLKATGEKKWTFQFEQYRNVTSVIYELFCSNEYMKVIRM